MLADFADVAAASFKVVIIGSETAVFGKIVHVDVSIKVDLLRVGVGRAVGVGLVWLYRRRLLFGDGGVWGGFVAAATYYEAEEDGD